MLKGVDILADAVSVTMGPKVTISSLFLKGFLVRTFKNLFHSFFFTFRFMEVRYVGHFGS
jgi:hypothetical protein